jgi:hypothetical protein
MFTETLRTSSEPHVYSSIFNVERKAGNEKDYSTPGGEDKERRLPQV